MLDNDFNHPEYVYTVGTMSMLHTMATDPAKLAVSDPNTIATILPCREKHQVNQLLQAQQ